MNMDRFRFRAWFNFAEDGWKMVELKQFYFVESTIYIEPIEMEGDIYGGLLEDCTLMQCTGRKDSTKWEELTLEEQEAWCRHSTSAEWEGRLIYEGDVVEMSNFQIEKLNGHGYIYWSDDGGMWMYRKGGEGGLPAILHKVNDYLKVLGNIYEHPSLLEADEE